MWWNYSFWSYEFPIPPTVSSYMIIILLNFLWNYILKLFACIFLSLPQEQIWLYFGLQNATLTYPFSHLEPVCCSMSSSNCCFLTCIQVSPEAGQVVWYSHLLLNFPQFILIHTVKGFGIVNKTGIDVFLELSCFFDDPADYGNLISDSSAFSKISFNIWKFTVRLLLKSGLENFEHYFASLWDECNCVLVWTFFGIVWHCLSLGISEHTFILSGFISRYPPLFPSSNIASFWHGEGRGSSFSVVTFCLFIQFMKFSL